MKKLALVAIVALATPALACPNHDEATPTKTAQKSDPKTDAKDAKDAKKPDTATNAKPAAPATPAKPADPNKPDKVSSR
jgi:hypothetical protein